MNFGILGPEPHIFSQIFSIRRTLKLDKIDDFDGIKNGLTFIISTSFVPRSPLKNKQLLF